MIVADLPGRVCKPAPEILLLIALAVEVEDRVGLIGRSGRLVILFDPVAVLVGARRDEAKLATTDVESVAKRDAVIAVQVGLGARCGPRVGKRPGEINAGLA